MNIGACDEILLRYNENGTLSQRFCVKSGSFNGVSKHYNSNGVLVKEYYLIDDCIKDGEYKEFYENGNVLMRNYADTSGKIVVWKWYDINGKELKRLIQHSVNKVFVSPEPN